MKTTEEIPAHDAAVIIADWNCGASQRSTADALGRDPGTIKRWRVMLGLPASRETDGRRRRHQHQERATDRQRKPATEALRVGGRGADSPGVAFVP